MLRQAADGMPASRSQRSAAQTVHGYRRCAKETACPWIAAARRIDIKCCVTLADRGVLLCARHCVVQRLSHWRPPFWRRRCLLAAQPPPEPPEFVGRLAVWPRPGRGQERGDRAGAVHGPRGRPARAALFITATIEPGWHIYSITQPPGGPLATKIEVSPPPGVRIAGKFQPSVAAGDEERAGLRQSDGRNPPRHGHLVRADRIGRGRRSGQAGDSRQGHRPGVRRQFVPAAAGLAVFGGAWAGDCACPAKPQAAGRPPLAA